MAETLLTTKSPTSLLAKAPTPSPTALAAQAAFVQKPKAVKASRKALTLADEQTEYLKIALYSQTGCGKTLAIAHLLEAGLTVCCLSTDFGGAGTSSVVQFLKERGNAHLLKNCYSFALESYDEVEEFVFNPEAFWPEIYSVGLDVLFFDGVSSLQMCLISDKVMSLEAVGNATPLRDAGLFASSQDWGGIKSASIKIIDKFLRMKNEKTGQPWHKIMTFLESDTVKAGNAGEVKTSMMLQGAAAKLMEPCFDLIIRLRKKRVVEGTEKKMTYFYETESGEKVVTKSRGFKFNPNEPGDFGLFWKKVCDQKGIPTGKRE